MYAVNLMAPIGECVTDPTANVDLLRPYTESRICSQAAAEVLGSGLPGRHLTLEDKSSGQLMKVRQELSRWGSGGRNPPGYFIRGNKKKTEGGAPKKPRPTPEPVERDYVFTESQVVADQPIRYGHASGDTNPIHMDDNTAKAAGHPGIILHGLCTMAFAGRALVNQYLDGDSTREAVQSPIQHGGPPGMEITTKGWVESETDTEMVIGLEATNQDGKPVLANCCYLQGIGPCPDGRILALLSLPFHYSLVLYPNRTPDVRNVGRFGLQHSPPVLT